MLGCVVAHVADGMSLIRIEEQRVLSWLISSDDDGQALHMPGQDCEPVIVRADEGLFPTAILPPECRAVGSLVWVTWGPYSAVPFSEKLG